MKIPNKVKKLFDETALIAFGTADRKGMPNVNVIFWKKILGDETVILIDNFWNMTKKNLSENNQVCLSFWNPETEEGYKLKGIATYSTEGDIYDEGKRFIQIKNPNRVPKGVVEIEIKEIYILTPGPDAGKQL